MGAPSSSSPLKRTPLYEAHKASVRSSCRSAAGDARRVLGLADEHRAVRERAGLFDVSHMGEIRVKGPGALAAVQKLTCNDASALVDGRPVHRVSDGARDVRGRLLTYRLASDDYLLVVNAANSPKDAAWAKRAQGPASRSRTSRRCGPSSPSRVPARSTFSSPSRRGARADPQLPLHDRQGLRRSVDRLATGYTGEDGFEVYARRRPRERSGCDLESGRPHGILPTVSGARHAPPRGEDGPLRQ